MKSVPYFLRSGYRAAVRLALEEVVSGCDSGDVVKQERGWKLFFLLPRMLLSRPCRGGLVPRRKLETRFQKFFAGDWAGLVADSEDLTSQASTARVRKSRRHHPDGKAARAEKLAMMGELSAARQALESAGVAPERQEHVEHPQESRAQTRRTEGATRSRIVDSGSPEAIRTRPRCFCVNLRSARRGAAPGPSGMTCEHLQPFLSPIETRSCCAKSPPSWRGVISLPQLCKFSDWVV